MTIDNMVAQLWIQFAKGTGKTAVSPQAIDAILKEVGPRRPDMNGLWEREGAEFLELAFKLGEDAAAAAAEDKSTVIEEKHIVSTMPAIMIACPC